MQFDPALNNHGLTYNPFKAIVSPRPIGWISTVSPEGIINLAPYSFFNAFTDKPPIVGFSSNGYKDSVKNIEATGEFVCNMVGLNMVEKMSLTSAPLPYGVSEMDYAGLESVNSHVVRPSRVAGVPAALECRLLSIQELHNLDGQGVESWLVLGQVVSIYIDDAYIKDGILDTLAIKPLARLGYQDYAAVERVFSLARPS